MSVNWKSEVVLITAGSFEGVSKALVSKAEELKATVIILARKRNIDNETFRREGNTFVFPVDFQDMEKIPDLYKHIIHVTEVCPTILINDIRYQLAGFVQNTPFEFYEKCYRANVLFPIALIQCMLPDMLRQNKGVIANIMSAVIYHSYPGLSAYFSAKAALGAIHESLRAELEGLPVKSLYIRPGGFLSNYWKNIHLSSRINDYRYPRTQDLRDTEYLAYRIFKAIEQGKVEINLGSLKDRIGYQLNYWAPKVLDKVISVKNRQLIEKTSTNFTEN